MKDMKITKHFFQRYNERVSSVKSLNQLNNIIENSMSTRQLNNLLFFKNHKNKILIPYLNYTMVIQNKTCITIY